MIFGQIVSFETPLEDKTIDENSSIFVVFNLPGRTPESTPVTRGTIVRSILNHGPLKMFVFNRPITQLEGQRLILQVFQCLWTGAQRLVGYGFCDLDLPPGNSSRIIRVPLWKPRTNQDERDSTCGTVSPLYDPEVVTFPDYVNRKELELVSQLGRVKIHIQRCEYC